MTLPPFTLHEPQSHDTAVMFSAPHSGRDYPKGFVAQSPLSLDVLRSSEDAFVDLLYKAAPSYGAPFLVAHAPRAYVDLNRGPDELDPSLIEDVTRTGFNPRISAGLGVIPRVVAGARVIHPSRIPLAEAHHRLNHVWHPYHHALSMMIERTFDRFGAALLIDCHSMPREAIPQRAHYPRPQIILGDRYGATCCPRVMDQVEAAFKAQGFHTHRNHPFAGAYILKACGKPAIHHHAVQVEIDRSLYMEEATLTPRPDFHETQARLTAVIAQLAQIGRNLRRKLAVAAE